MLINYNKVVLYYVKGTTIAIIATEVTKRDLFTNL